MKCIECIHSKCFRRGSNPVISVCEIIKECGEPYRMVANSTHGCDLFVRFQGIVKPVEQIPYGSDR